MVLSGPEAAADLGQPATTRIEAERSRARTTRATGAAAGSVARATALTMLFTASPPSSIADTDPPGRAHDAPRKV